MIQQSERYIHRRLLAGASLLALASLVSMLLSIVTGLIVVRILIPEQFGKIAYFLQVFGLARFVSNLGLGAKVIQDVSRGALSEDPLGVNHVIYSLGLVRFASSCLLGIGLLMIARFTGDVMFLWTAWAAMAASFFDYASAVAQGLRNRSLVAWVTAIQPTLYLLVVVVIALGQQARPYHVYAAMTLSFVVSLFIFGVKLKRHILWPRRAFVSHTYLKQSLAPLASLFVFGMVIQLYSAIGTLILGQLQHFVSAAFFGAAFTLVTMPVSLGFIVVTGVFYPEMVIALSQDDRNVAGRLLDLFVRSFSLFAAFVIAGCVVYADILIGVLYPSEYESSIIPLIVLAPTIIGGLLQLVFVFTIVSMHKIYLASTISVMQILMVIFGTAISLYIGSSFIPIGVGLSYLISALAGCMGLWHVVNREIPFKTSIFYVILTVLVAIASMGFGRMISMQVNAQPAIVTLIMGVMITLPIYFLLVIFLLLTPNERQSVQRNIRPLFQHSRISVLVVILVLWGEPTKAQDCHVRQKNAVNDNQPALTIIQCPYANNQDDLVYVFDRAANRQETSDWQSSTDFEDDLWLFDAKGDGTVNLIIDFYREDTTLVAALYDDQDGDGQVSIEIQDDHPQIIESNHPTIKVVSLDSQWGFNLDIFVDGLVRAQFGLGEFQNGIWNSFLPDDVWEQVRTDGKIDYVTRVRDPDQDGHPDYFFTQNYLPIPKNWGTLRLEMAYNPFDDEAPPIDGALFWYLLGNPTGFTQNYLENPSPLQMDWTHSKIISLTEFVASRGNDHNCFIYSIAQFEQNQLNLPNFENPFCFYDLADDLDGYPELQARIGYFHPHDRHWLFGKYDEAVGMVRYSWDQDNDGFWDYKVDLAGRNEITQIVEFPEFSLKSLPYDHVPHWITENAWDVVTFVSVEGRYPASTEGIYEWNIPFLTQRDYITGRTEETGFDTEDYYDNQGLRAEYQFQHLDQPYLYLSPLDAELHLLNAAGGVWQIADVERVEYENLNGDPFIDRWVYLQDDIVRGQLIQTSSHLIATSEDSVYLLEAEIPTAHLTILPPRNHEEWVQLGQHLDQFQRDIASNDFLQMLNQFGTPQWRIRGASIHGFRFTEDGFQFVLTLEGGFMSDSDLQIRTESNLQPGHYLIESHQGQLTIESLTPAALSIEVNSPPNAAEAVAWEPQEINLIVHNVGTQDASDLMIEVYAEQGKTRHLIEEMTMAVLAKRSEQIGVIWTPTNDGEWVIHVEALFDNTLFPESSYAQTLKLPFIVHQPNVDLTDLLSLRGDQPGSGWFVVVLLGVLVGVGVCLSLIFFYNQ